MHPYLTQAPVLETAAPPHGVIEVYSGSQVGKRIPRTPEGEGDEGMLPVWDILKGLFLGEALNILNNLSRLSMMCNVCHQWPGGAHFVLNFYRHKIKILVRRPG